MPRTKRAAAQPAAPTIATQKSTPSILSEPGYSFPVIRGIQCGREYYVGMVPVRLLKKLFNLDPEYIPPEHRDQRILNLRRVTTMAQYVVEGFLGYMARFKNQEAKDQVEEKMRRVGYIYSAAVVTIDAAPDQDMNFTPLSNGESADLGMLTFIMSAPLRIIDGQHRLYSLIKAYTLLGPEIEDETIPIVWFVDIGPVWRQQAFSDLNRYPVKPSKSLNQLYDHRDVVAEITRSVIAQVPLFTRFTDNDLTSLPVKSTKLFTFTALYEANDLLLGSSKTRPDLPKATAKAVEYWKAVVEIMHPWQQVATGETTAVDIRQNSLASHNIAIAALGSLGYGLLSRENWKELLGYLEDFDWSRTNPNWVKKGVISNGRVIKNRATMLMFRDVVIYHMRRKEFPEDYARLEERERDLIAAGSPPENAAIRGELEEKGL